MCSEHGTGVKSGVKDIKSHTRGKNSRNWKKYVLVLRIAQAFKARDMGEDAYEKYVGAVVNKIYR